MVSKIGVVGSGQMGSGIAQVMATAEMEVKVLVLDSSALERSRIGILKSLTKLAEKDRLSGQAPEDILGRVSFENQTKALHSSDLVIEAVTENTDLKLNIFRELDKKCQPACILATNTSSISITKIAQVTSRPEQIIGMHFMNPVPLMQLVEVIKAMQTSEETLKTVWSVIEKLEKTPVLAKDSPGFMVNRILAPMINEAFFLLQEGNSPKDIDSAMVLGTNQPMGPLTLADLIGLDTCLYIMEVLHRELGESKYRPCPLLVKYVEAGWYGRKSKKGVYTY